MEEYLRMQDSYCWTWLLTTYLRYCTHTVYNCYIPKHAHTHMHTQTHAHTDTHTHSRVHAHTQSQIKAIIIVIQSNNIHYNQFSKMIKCHV